MTETGAAENGGNVEGERGRSEDGRMLAGTSKKDA